MHPWPIGRAWALARRNLPGTSTAAVPCTGVTAMKRTPSNVTIILAGLTLLVLVLSAPASLRDAYNRGGFYLFSRSFIEDIPGRLTGPGWFRFILQPLVAAFLGIKNGIADAGCGRPPYLFGVLFNQSLRRELLASAFTTVVNLLLMGILLDSVFQYIILGASYPGAALVVGPTLVAAPYAVARALTNRISRLRNGQ